MTRSKGRSGERSKVSAVSPSPATSTLYPSASRLKRRPSARCFSSSTIKTLVILFWLQTARETQCVLCVSCILGLRKHNGEGAPQPLSRTFRENSASVAFDYGPDNEEPEP